MRKQFPGVTSLAQTIADALHAANANPMPCNMFSKPCDLLTCHSKRRCLWTKEEAVNSTVESPALYSDLHQLNTPIHGNTQD